MGTINVAARHQQPPRSQAERHIVWRIFCPRCLTAVEGLEHRGLADVAHPFKCARCRGRFTVRTGVSATGGPICDATPVFIKAPEIIDDNDPVGLP